MRWMVHHWQAWPSLASALLPATRQRRGQEASLRPSSSSRGTGSTSAVQHQVQHEMNWSFILLTLRGLSLIKSLCCRNVANLQVEDPHEWKLMLQKRGKPASRRPPWMKAYVAETLQTCKWKTPMNEACVADMWQTCKWKTPMNESLYCRYVANLQVEDPHEWTLMRNV